MGTLVYAPLMEQSTEDCSGWSKETIAYITQKRNKRKIERQIRGIARGLRRNIQATDVEDIFSEIVLYMYRSDDYNLNKAIERSNSGSIVSLDGYINSCIKYCVIRYCANLNGRDRATVSDTVYSQDDDKEMSIFDTIPDSNSEITLDHLIYDLDTLCKSCECLRYRYGPDIYLVWYIRLLTMDRQNSEIYNSILNILGISKFDLQNIERVNEDEVMISFAKAINLYGVDEAKRIIKPYVFSAQLIEDTVEWAYTGVDKVTVVV